MTYRHIIWDWNGTLLDDAWLCLEILNGILTKRKMPAVNAASYQEQFGFPVVDYYRHIGFDFAVEPFTALAAEFTAEYDVRRFDCRLQHGAVHVLESLAGQGCRQAVLSAYEQSRLDEMIGFNRLDRYFTHLLGLDDNHAHSKVENGVQLLKALACDPSETLLIGDTLHDYEVAQAMGVDCVLIPSGHASPQRLSASGARVVESLGELEEVL